MKKIIITGHTSTISQNLMKLAQEKNPGIKIIKVGRSADSDLHINFFDLTDMRKFVDFVGSEKANYLFLNHGVLIGKKLNQMTQQEIQETLTCNMISYLTLMESLPMINNLRTVVMSSISSKLGSFATLYAASKTGVDLAVKSIAPTLPTTSRLNAVSPGIISDTKMTQARTDLHIIEQKTQSTPTKQLTSSNDVAKAIAYLLFDNENINGENLNINGGLFCS